jgi:hypothetical protein
VQSTDVARFVVDDDASLVNASFACPYCLHTATDVELNLDDAFGSAATCWCHGCSRDWVVVLNFGQAMRLALAPPTGLECTPA